MRALWQKYKKLFFSAFLLGLPFVFFYVNAKEARELNFFDEIILKISAPVQHATRFVIDSAFDLWDDYVYLRDQRVQNRRLARELSRLRSVETRLREVQSENERMGKLLELRDRMRGIHRVAARVIARSVSPYFRVHRVRIDSGSKAGIERGMPVVTGDGVVGRIHRVYGDYADVQLVADPKSSIDIIVQGTRATGFLRGRGESNNYRCRIEHLSLRDAVRDGDVIITSGLGQGNRFPKGLVVGRVSHVLSKQFAVGQEVDVLPAVDFSKVEEVFVLKDGAGVFVPPPKPGAPSAAGASAAPGTADMPTAPPPIETGEDARDAVPADAPIAPAPSIDPREIGGGERKRRLPRPEEVVPP
jgi:rod shape-determining protein MreC